MSHCIWAFEASVSLGSTTISQLSMQDYLERPRYEVTTASDQEKLLMENRWG